MTKDKRKKKKHIPKISEVGKEKHIPEFKFHDSGLRCWQLGDLVLDPEAAFTWANCQDITKTLCKLGELEGKGFDELSRQGSHPVGLTGLTKAGMIAVQSKYKLPPEEIFSLRLSGAERVICLSHGCVMKVVWWDPTHDFVWTKQRHKEKDRAT